MLISCMNVDVLSYERQFYHKCEKSEMKIAKYIIAWNSLPHSKMEKFITAIYLKQTMRGFFIDLMNVCVNGFVPLGSHRPFRAVF